MTAKKMADIFFGKFSELVSNKEVPKNEKSNEVKKELPVTKKSNKNIYIYSSIVLLMIIIIGYFIF